MKSKSGIVVKGIADLSVRFSKCCSPVPGDEIVGYVTGFAFQSRRYQRQ